MNVHSWVDDVIDLLPDLCWLVLYALKHSLSRASTDMTRVSTDIKLAVNLNSSFK